MRKIVTSKEMKAIDHFAIKNCGIPGLVLMENAGIRITEFLRGKGKKVLVFAGKGNNGGDGFVVARHLFIDGIDVQVFLLGKLGSLKKDARVNADSAFNIGIPIKEIGFRNIKSCDHPLRHCHVIVDAIFGTGLTTTVGGIYEKIIKKINAAGKYVLSIDIPSGIDSDTGQIIGPHVQADLTVALGMLKRSHLLFPAADVMGEMQVVNISLPQKALEHKPIAVNLIEEKDIRSYFDKRPDNSHKGNYGHVLVIGGSRGKGGAAGLTALAALRGGAGLVTLALPQGCHKALEFNPLEVMSVSLPETRQGNIARSAKDLILEHCLGKTAVAIGPGLSTDQETVELLADVLPLIQCTLIIDADGLNGLTLSKGLITKLPPNTILTPHPKEMSRLCGKETSKILENSIETALKFAVKYSLYIVLKGARTLTALPDGTIYMNPTGNPGMATAGSGDVLTGIIAGLAAQGFNPKTSCVSGVYIHGLAGDLFASKNSQTMLIAGDLLHYLPKTIKHILP